MIATPYWGSYFLSLSASTYNSCHDCAGYCSSNLCSVGSCKGGCFPIGCGGGCDSGCSTGCNNTCDTYCGEFSCSKTCYGLATKKWYPN